MRIRSSMFIVCCALPLTGCETIEENPRTSGAIIGGLAGAGVGAAVGGEEHRTEGALIGGAAGAGGGWLVGDQVDKKNDEKEDDRRRERARRQRDRDYEYERAREAGYSDRFYDREYDD
jgi:uncharacterized protein YcfJ